MKKYIIYLFLVFSIFAAAATLFSKNFKTETISANRPLTIKSILENQGNVDYITQIAENEQKSADRIGHSTELIGYMTDLEADGKSLPKNCIDPADAIYIAAQALNQRGVPHMGIDDVNDFSLRYGGITGTGRSYTNAISYYEELDSWSVRFHIPATYISGDTGYCTLVVPCNTAKDSQNFESIEDVCEDFLYL